MSQRNQAIEVGQFAPTQDTRLGRMLTAGRLTVTMRSKRTGEHVTLTLEAMKKAERWQHATLSEASHVFIKMGQGGYGSSKVGTFYPATGKLYFDTPDKAWQFATLETLLSARVGVQETSTYELREADLCGKCGRELTDPVSIERGIGPTCIGALTGSVHYHAPQATRGTVAQVPVFDEAVMPGAQKLYDDLRPAVTDKRGRPVPRTFEALVASVQR